MRKLKVILVKSGAAFDYLLSGLVYAASVLLAFIMLSVCWDVVARAVAGRPLPWVLEVTEYSLLYITFLCTGWVLKNEGHVNTDLLLIALSKKRRAFMNFATSIMGAAVCAVTGWYGLMVSLDKLRQGSYQPTAMEAPDFILFIIIPFGFFVLFIQFMRRMAHYYSSWRGRVENHPPA